LAGHLFGSEFPNEGFRQHLYDRLKDEAYLKKDGIDSAIRALVEFIVINNFEYKIKRAFDFHDDDEDEIFDGVRTDVAKGFDDGSLNITRLVNDA
jgi:hypothetical protein